MNKNDITNSARLDAIQARFALRLTAGLTEQAEQLSPDISERLRHAREQAMARARTSQQLAPAQATVRSGGGTLALGGPDEAPWWNKIAVILPLLALAAGLLLIQHWHDQKHISAAADIDMSLLSDDLPPDAYGDPGFLEFLNTPRD